MWRITRCAVRAGFSRLGTQLFQPLERQRQMGAALGRDQGMNLFHDDHVDRREALPCVRREQQEERFRRRDENVGRTAKKARPFARGRVAGADGDLRHGHVESCCDRRAGNARQRHPQVAFDIDRERLERRDVEHAAPLVSGRNRLEEQAIEAPEERRQRLAASGRRQDQRRLAARDRRPSELLRLGGRRKLAREPRAHGRVEEFERPGSHGAILDGPPTTNHQPSSV